MAGVVVGLPWQGCLALAGITWISSSGIVARLLDDLGRLANRETPSALSVLVLLAAHRHGHRLGRLLAHDDDEQVVLRLLGITLLVAGLAQALGAAAAVGAFLVGIAVPTAFADRARAILRPLRDVFASIFFVAFGLATDPTAALPVLPVVLVLALLTTASKVTSGAFAARRDGIGRAGQLRAGAALVARGEFSIVIAGLAVSAGLDEVGVVATGYVLVMAVIGPVLARVVEPLAGRVGALPRDVLRPAR